MTGQTQPSKQQFTEAPTLPRGGPRPAPPGGTGGTRGGRRPEESPAPLSRRITDWAVRHAGSPLTARLALLAVLLLAAAFRLYALGATGLNSDEAVYAGTARSIAGDPVSRSLFPVFRAHPLLFQTALSLFSGGAGTPSDTVVRLLPAACGVGTVAVTYALGARLYGRGAGLLAALFLAVMPYHVVVSRQVLLDGPMTLCATGALYCLARYAEPGQAVQRTGPAVGPAAAQGRWLAAAGGLLGAAVLTKETSAILLGSVLVFLVLTPAVRVRLRPLLGALLALLAVVAAYPVVLSASGRASTGRHYLLWQFFRRANHSYDFYGAVVPSALGWAVLAAALAGLVLLRGRDDHRVGLLLSWIAVPVLFFTLWPVKGFQYLLPIAPPTAVLAGRAVAALARARRPAALFGRAGLFGRHRLAAPAGCLLAAAAIAASLAVPAWGRIAPDGSAARSGHFLAGSGGLPGGREAGRWVQSRTPPGSTLLAIGPSMANLLEYYSHHRVYGLSVSPDPRNRNPAYVPVPNPDRDLTEGRFQYLVWDAYSAARAGFFAAQAERLVAKHHGVAVFTATAPGAPTRPVVIIYQLRP